MQLEVQAYHCEELRGQIYRHLLFFLLPLLLLLLLLRGTSPSPKLFHTPFNVLDIPNVPRSIEGSFVSLDGGLMLAVVRGVQAY